MKRVLTVCGLLLVAGIGVFGQSSREGIRNSYDPVNEGGTYQASLCAQGAWLPSAAYANNFYMHATTKKSGDWFEVEVSAQLDEASQRLKAPIEPIRLNTSRLCYVKVLSPRPER